MTLFLGYIAVSLLIALVAGISQDSFDKESKAYDYCFMGILGGMSGLWPLFATFYLVAKFSDWLSHKVKDFNIWLYFQQKHSK